MLSHLNLKSPIPVQTTAYARKLHLNNVTDRLMQFQITLKLWEAHTQEKRINSRFPLVSFPLQYTSHKNGYGTLPITAPLRLKPQIPKIVDEKVRHGAEKWIFEILWCVTYLYAE